MVINTIFRFYVENEKKIWVKDHLTCLLFHPCCRQICNVLIRIQTPSMWLYFGTGSTCVVDSTCFVMRFGWALNITKYFPILNISLVEQWESLDQEGWFQVCNFTFHRAVYELTNNIRETQNSLLQHKLFCCLTDCNIKRTNWFHLHVELKS